MSNPINIIPNNNEVILQNNNGNITVINNNNGNKVIVTQPITSTVQILTGLPGSNGVSGPSGSQGDPGPSLPFDLLENNTFYTTSSIQITGSLIISGSNIFKNIGLAQFTGSLNITGSGNLNNYKILTTNDTGSLLLISNFNQFTSSYLIDSSSFNLSISLLNNNTSSYITNSQTSSMNVLSSSYSQTASYVANASSFPYTGSALVTGSIELTGSYSNLPYIITSSINQIIDWSISNTFDILLTMSMAVTWSNNKNGQTINLIIHQGTFPSGNLATFPSTTLFPGGLYPTQSLTGGKTDIYTFICIGNTIYGNYIQNY